MKAIIFGVSGQDGFYLSQILRRHNIEPVGVSRSKGDWITGDIADFAQVERLIKEHRPHYIFHLAANSVTSHEALFENHETISTGSLNILEAVYRHSRQTKVFISGSAVQFENKGQPIDEKTPFAALSPYAVARIQSVYAARYFRSLGIKAYVGYFFHHDSPLRGENHINQKIVRAVQRIAQGSDETIGIGDWTVRKEFNFAGDLMEAVWLLVSQEECFEAVLGCGEAHSLQEWAFACFKLVGSSASDCLVASPEYKPDFDILYSNPEKISALGWRPKVNFLKLAKLMLA